MPNRTDIRAAVKAICTGLYHNPQFTISGADEPAADGVYTLVSGPGYFASDDASRWENANGYFFAPHSLLTPAIDPDGWAFFYQSIYGIRHAAPTAAGQYPWQVDWINYAGAGTLDVATLTPTGQLTVYAGRRGAIPENAIPAACVYVEGEEKQPAAMGSSHYERRVTVTTEIHVQENTTEAVKNALDALCARREDLMLTDETLGGLVHTITLQQDEYEIDEENRRPAGVAVCRDQLIYRA